MMKVCITPVKLKTARQATFSFDEPVSPEAFGHDDFTLCGNVTAEGSIRLSEDRSFACTFHYTAQAELVCSRCGKHFVYPVEGDAEVAFAAIQGEDEQGEITRYPMKGEEVDLTVPVLDEIRFQLPMQPLCRETCKGLCPICGIDRNEHNCSCEDEQIDPRWEKLKQLRLQD